MKENATPSKRQKVSNVSDSILGMLAESDMTAQQMVEKGGFSMAGAFLNIKKLKAAGKIVGNRDGRQINYSLAKKGAAKGSGKAPAVTGRGKSEGVKSLRDAVEMIKNAFKPVEDIKDKVDLLDALAANTPKAASKLLLKIKSDLLSRNPT